MALKKIDAIFKLILKLIEKKEISSYDEDILTEFNCSQRTLERYLKEIENNFTHIITIKKSHQKYWKVIGVADILEEFMRNSNDISTLFYLAKDYDPNIFKDLEESTLNKVARKDEDIFIFRNSIMEELKEDEAKKNFNLLKKAIKSKNWIRLEFKVRGMEPIVKGIPYRLIFIDNNWYIGLIIKNNKCILRRVVFIKNITLLKEKHNINSHSCLDYLKSIQNSLTLHNTPFKVARIKATKEISHYFEKGMKKFLPSQKFLEKKEDGSVIFEVSYTQDLEILIFIQKFLPDLIILEPKELRESFIKKLEKALIYNKNKD